MAICKIWDKIAKKFKKRPVLLGFTDGYGLILIRGRGGSIAFFPLERGKTLPDPNARPIIVMSPELFHAISNFNVLDVPQGQPLIFSELHSLPEDIQRKAMEDLAKMIEEQKEGEEYIR